MADDWGLLEPLGAAASATSDDAVLAALVEVERGLLRAWGGVLDEDLSADAAALDAGTLDREALLAGARSGGVPVIALVGQLRAQAEAIGEGAGDRVHAGATSQDILDSALVLVARDALAEARGHLAAAGGALVALARQDGSGNLRPELAVAKAYGVLALGMTNRAIAARAADSPEFFTSVAALAGGRILSVPGGVFVRDAEGALLGAVGVTGDTSLHDEAAAVAGITAAGLVPVTGAE